MTFEDVPIIAKVLTAGVSGCIADFATFPLDTAKVRLQIQSGGRGIVAAMLAAEGGVMGGSNQLQYRGIFDTMATVARNEGHRALYNGLSAGLQRQMAFASVRLGLYDTVKGVYQPFFDGASSRAGASEAGVCARVAAGLTTGGLAVLIAQPTDVVKLRFQARGNTNPRAVRYKSTIQAYKHIARTAGIKGLWRGVTPNISRNAIINVGEIVCYDLVKDAIIRHELLRDGVPCHFVSAVVAGFCATVVASPVDVVKTRVMSSAGGVGSAGAIATAVSMLFNEGPASFYKGFAPSFCRLVSWNICMWLTYEQMKKLVSDVHNMHVAKKSQVQSFQDTAIDN